MSIANLEFIVFCMKEGRGLLGSELLSEPLSKKVD